MILSTLQDRNLISSSYQEQVLATAEAELDRLLADFHSSPSRTGLSDIGAAAEVLVLGRDFPAAGALTAALADAASCWLRSGLLEDLFFFGDSGLAYHVALLSYLGQQRCEQLAAGLRDQNKETRLIERMFDDRLIGQSEMPVLMQQVISTYLTFCGIQADLQEPREWDLATSIDKRVLRARSDEYDLLVLIMAAQLLQLNHGCRQQKHKLFPQVLLVQAMRSCHLNWIPILALLCAVVFDQPPLRLEVSAVECLLVSLPSSELLPPPKGIGCDSAHIKRASRGLRLRSTIALALLIDHINGGSIS
jgi:hypothetical protein